MQSPFRLVAVLATIGLTACAVTPGPVEQQATQASIACQQGYKQACGTAAALAPAASAERAQAQQDANVGTAVAVGVLGAVAGAAIISSSQPRYYRRPYYGRGHYRRW